MFRFRLISFFYSARNKKEPRNYIPIRMDPSYDSYGDELYQRKGDLSFASVLRMYRWLPVLRRADRVGVLSLIYWEYYNELHAFLSSLAEKPWQRRRHKLTNLYFYYFHLKRWVAFVRCSDDTMFPQNETIRDLEGVLRSLYFSKKHSYFSRKS